MQGLHWLPTLDCLALSPDPAIKARAAAALAALVTAGQLDSQEAQIRWRDMLLGWLGNSTAGQLLATSSSGGGGGGATWLWGWLTDSGAGGAAGTSSRRPGARGSEAEEALARSCVAALKGAALC